MAIIQSNDDGLRQIIFEKPKVIVMFTDVKCKVCKQLIPAYEKAANNITYKDITFLTMDAAENPVSSQEVKLSGTPFFAIYRESVLEFCSLINTDAGLEHLLDRLLNQPSESSDLQL